MAQIQTSVYGLITFVNEHGKVLIKISTTVNGEHAESVGETIKNYWPHWRKSLSEILAVILATNFGSADSLVIMTSEQVLASHFFGTDADFFAENRRYQLMFDYPDFHPEWNNRNATCVTVIQV